MTPCEQYAPWEHSAELLRGQHCGPCVGDEGIEPQVCSFCIQINLAFVYN